MYVLFAYIYFIQLQKDSIMTSIRRNGKQLVDAKDKELLAMTKRLLPVLTEAKCELVRVEEKMRAQRLTLKFMSTLKEGIRKELELVQIFHQLKLFGENRIRDCPNEPNVQLYVYVYKFVF